MSTPTPSPPSPADLPTVLAAIRDTIARAEAGVDALLDAAARSLALFTDVVGYGLRTGLAELRRDFERFIDEVEHLLTETGDPVGLRHLGSVWAGNIGGRVSRIAGLATLNGIRADDHWSGPASDAYRNTLPVQQAALAAIKTAGDELDAGLNELANAIVKFWVDIATIMIAFVGALVFALATTGTVLGAPVGVPVALAAIGGAAALVNGSVDALTAVTSTANTNTAALTRRLTNDLAFHQGLWPVSTTPISGDGSITDGDDTDWHVK